MELELKQWGMHPEAITARTTHQIRAYQIPFGTIEDEGTAFSASTTRGDQNKWVGRYETFDQALGALTTAEKEWLDTIESEMRQHRSETITWREVTPESATILVPDSSLKLHKHADPAWLKRSCEMIHHDSDATCSNPIGWTNNGWVPAYISSVGVAACVTCQSSLDWCHGSSFPAEVAA